MKQIPSVDKSRHGFSGLKSRPALLSSLPGAKPGCLVCLAVRGFLTRKTPIGPFQREKMGGWQGHRTQAGLPPAKDENADSAHFGRRKAYLSLSIDGKDSGWYGQPANGERARKTFDVVSNALLSQRRRSRNLAAEMLRGKNRSG